LEATTVRPLSELQADTSLAPIRPVVSPLPGALSPAAAQAQPGATLLSHPATSAGAGPTGVALSPALEASHAVQAAQAASLVASANSLHRWRTAAIVLGALVLVGGSVTGTVLYMRRGAAPPVVVVHGSGGPEDPRAYGPGGARDRRPPFDPLRPPGPPPPPGSAHSGHRGPPPPGGPGSEVAPVAGTAGGSAVAPAMGTGAPAVATPAVAKLPDESVPSKAPQYLTVKGAVEQVSLEKDGFLVARRLSQGKQPLKVVGPEEQDGRRQVLGQATVLGAASKLGGTWVKLDAAAASASRERFVVLPEPAAPSAPSAPEPDAELALEQPSKIEPPPPPAPPAPVGPPRTLLGGVKRTSLLGLGPVGKGFSIRNAEDVAWWDCKLTLDKKRRLALRGLPAKSEKSVDLGDFKPHADAPMVEKNEMHVECNEGSALFTIQH
jgi:hypothetical protein